MCLWVWAALQLGWEHSEGLGVCIHYCPRCWYRTFGKSMRKARVILGHSLRVKSVMAGSGSRDIHNLEAERKMLVLSLLHALTWSHGTVPLRFRTDFPHLLVLSRDSPPDKFLRFVSMVRLGPTRLTSEWRHTKEKPRGKKKKEKPRLGWRCMEAGEEKVFILLASMFSDMESNVTKG